MNQAIHIFKKDVRYLRWEIALLLTAAASLAVAKIGRPYEDGFRWMTFLPLAWAFVCARLIQAETLPGDRQFWITRPYDWRSLLGAKLLFVACFISAPMFIANAVFLAKSGFSVSSHLAGLICSTALIAFGPLLAMCALAAVTRGLAQWILSGLAIFLGFSELTGFGPWHNWAGMEWMRELGQVLILATIASIVLIWQYHRRMTLASRILLTLGLLGTWAYARFTPPAAAWALETRFSQPKADSSSIQLTVHPALPRTDPFASSIPFSRSREAVALLIPLDVSGLVPGLDLFEDQVRISVAMPYEQEWSAEVDRSDLFQHRQNGYFLVIDVDRGVFEKSKQKQVNLGLRLNLTLLGNPVSQTIEWGTGQTPVPGIGLCSLAQPREVLLAVCRSAMRPASNMLSVQARGTDRRFFGSPSYSPLPAELALVPIYHYFNEVTGPSVTLTTREPLAHFHRVIEVHNVSLADYEAGHSALTQK